MCTMYMYCVCGDQKRVLDPLGLDFQVVGSHHIHAGNQTQDLKRGSEWSQLLSHPLLQALGILIFSYCFSNFSHSKLQSLEVPGGGKPCGGRGLSVSLIKTVLRKQNILIPRGDKKDNRESS